MIEIQYRRSDNHPCRVSSCIRGTSNGIVPFRFLVLAIVAYLGTVNGVHPHAVVCVQRAEKSVSHTEVVLFIGTEKILRAHV